jgi:cytochrome b involved in lipid metabolism
LDAFKVLGVLEPMPELKVITREELAKHNTRKSCWVAINRKVYDLSTVLFWHPPGPEAVLMHAGKDATVLFEAVHPGHYLGHFDPVAILDDTEVVSKSKEEVQLDSISKEELSAHNTKDDCWVAIHGVIFNLTDVLKWHPDGADSIMEHAGKNGTEYFSDQHSKDYLNNLTPVGILEEEEMNIEHDDL